MVETLALETIEIWRWQSSGDHDDDDKAPTMMRASLIGVAVC